MRFRKKPIVIEAEQVPRVEEDRIVQYWPELGCVFRRWRRGIWIETLEGWMRVTPGDWIITGVKGERYPCKPDIFEMTYNSVHETPGGSQ